eukprot:15653358-Heterocapsa_arctica.AAC.1
MITPVVGVIITPTSFGESKSKEFDGKKLKSTTKEDLDIKDEDEKKKLELKADFDSLMNFMKETMGDGYAAGDYNEFCEQFGRSYFAKIMEKKNGYKNFYEQFGTSLKLKK